tara:strand:+ start:5528 stop:5881 length:354 start_codon:yes stop_codon:yes gene_type:complete
LESKSRNNNWVPEICYEEQSGGLSSHIPFIQVPNEEEMPKLLYIFESRETGEVEPGENGEDLPVFEMDLHQYADMNILKKGLSPDQYDSVRECLGLNPMKEAVPQGRQITENIREKL